MATEVIERAVLRLSLRGLNATAALILFWSLAGGIALVPATASAQADDVATAEVKALEVTQEDYAAARSPDSWCYHTMPGRTPAAKRFSQDRPSTELPGNLFELETSDLPSYQPPSLPNPPTPSFYPDELFNIGLLVSGTTTPGPTIVGAQLHPIYLSAPNVSGAGRCATGSCWGNPKQFLTDFGPSTFSHILDQYVGSSALNRYTLGTQFSASQLIFGGTSGTPTFSQNDILALVHAAAKVAGSGLPHIYHVFIPPNVNTCLDYNVPLVPAGQCFSPDNLATFGFCAYHSAVKFTDITETVYYTVLPWFGNASECLVPTSNPTPPNGQLTDSEDIILEHELAETITDPNVQIDSNGGFRSVLQRPTRNFEIADLCGTGLRFTEVLNGHKYELQLLYSNTYQACASTP